MKRMKRGLTGVLAASVACFGCKPVPMATSPVMSLARQPCEERTEFKSEVNIVLLDRTTRLSQQDQERWVRGLAALLSLEEMAGRIELLDLVAVGKLAGRPFTVCYPASLNRPAGSEEPGDIAHRLGRFLSDWRYGTSKSKRPTSERVMEINAARKEQRDFLVDVPATRPIDATKTTDIERPVREAISKQCRGARVCRLLMFTDLMDTEVQRRLATLDLTSSIELGAGYANTLMDTSGQWVPDVVIQVVVWNFGRDERGENSQVPIEVQQKLEAFWTAYFSSICKRAARGSGISISLEEPRDLPHQCS